MKLGFEISLIELDSFSTTVLTIASVFWISSATFEVAFEAFFELAFFVAIFPP